jgi:hypothetical protein
MAGRQRRHLRKTRLTLYIGVLDRMLNLGQSTHGPRPNRPTNLDFARSLQFEIVQLPLGEIGSRKQKRHTTCMVLRSVGLIGSNSRLTLVRINKFHRWTKCLHRSLAG